MTPAGPILLYSIYHSDIPRFERLLVHALPDIPIYCASTPEEAARYFESTAVLYGWGFPPEMLEQMPSLRWVQKIGAGVDEIIERWPFGRDVVLTRTDGRLIAPRMAEYVLGAILDKTLRFDRARRQQQQRIWEFFEIDTIRDLTIGIAGLGEIGSVVADTLRRRGARTLGWRRSPAPSSVVDELFTGEAALPRFVGVCDVLVLVLPLTKKTKHLFGADIFAHCRRGMHLINIGRGALIDEHALLSAIDANVVAHATLDVFATEPLPADHPFWSNPHVTITPHVCGPLVAEDVVPHFIANYEAFSRGRPLKNVVDLEKQY
jgi:glyoxylate/hydroxypyruvate reductase A